MEKKLRILQGKPLSVHLLQFCLEILNNQIILNFRQLIKKN